MTTEEQFTELLKISKENTDVLHFIQENMVMKDEFQEFKDETSANFARLRNEFTTELRAIRNELEEVKTRLTQIEQRTMEDSDAMAADNLEFRQKIQQLETRVTQLETAKILT